MSDIKIDIDKEQEKKHISFSEYHCFKQCQYKWFLTYYLKHKEPTNDSLIFGKSLHETIEHILSDYKNKNNYHDCLTQRIIANSSLQYSKTVFGLKMHKEGIALIEQLDFYNRFKGIDIAGIEESIYSYLDTIDGVEYCFKGFIDFVGKVKNNEKYIVLDWKTANDQWDLQKKVGNVNFDIIHKKIINNEKLTIKEKESLQVKLFFGQVYFYRHYLSKMYDIDKNDIDMQYTVFNRKDKTITEYEIEVNNCFEDYVFDDIRNVLRKIVYFKKDNNIFLEKDGKYCNFCYFNNKQCIKDETKNK